MSVLSQLFGRKPTFANIFQLLKYVGMSKDELVKLLIPPTKYEKFVTTIADKLDKQSPVTNRSRAVLALDAVIEQIL